MSSAKRTPKDSQSQTDGANFLIDVAPRVGNEALLLDAEAKLNDLKEHLESEKPALLDRVFEVKKLVAAARAQIAEATSGLPNLAKYAWRNGKIVCLKDAQIHGLSHTLHYGDGVFEGIRFYKTDKGSAVFRLSEHVDRLIYSARVLEMELPWSKAELASAVTTTVRENISGDGAKYFPRGEGYIRPILVRGPEKQGLQPGGAKINYFVFCWDMGDYIKSEMLDISLSSYKRIHPQTTVADAKICGHYVNSILAALELKKTGAHEALLLDCDGKLAEGAGENLFVIKSGQIYTPCLGNILAGITRDTIIQVSKAAGVKLNEGEMDIDDLLTADEAFFTGTAAEVKPIRALNEQVIGDGKIGPVTKKMKDAYSDIVHGRMAQYGEWLTHV